MVKKLNELNMGESAFIEKINIDSDMLRRLNDLGFFKGVLIKCVFNSPFKDPKAYLVNDTLLAIRDKDAINIEVKIANE